MKRIRLLKWAGAALLGLVGLILLFVAGLALFGGNWLREPIARAVFERTGRTLAIGGDVRFGLGWPLLRVRAGQVTFSNPAWARQAANMVAADEVELGVNLPQFFRQRAVIDELTLRRADVSLETDAEGRKNWLLDLEQKDESARVAIGRMALHATRIGYDERPRGTSIRAELSSTGAAGSELAFSANGQYLRMPLSAHGSGGSLLRLRDESKPYPFKVEATIGPTRIKAEGSVTGLSEVSALDVKVDVSGDSLAQLFPLLRIALPETPAYRTAGHIEHAGQSWRYEKFSTRVGDSDFTGTLKVDTGGQRPFLHGEVIFGRLDLADLGPVIGTTRTAAENGKKLNGKAPPGMVRKGKQARAPSGPTATGRRVLPVMPFSAERWSTVDADVRLSARSIVRPNELPLERFVTHLMLRDAVLVLDPLEFGLAGGRLAAAVTLDGRKKPIAASAKVRANEIALDRMFPGFNKNMVNPGRVDGQAELAGKGDSVGQMLGNASGTAALVVAGGHVSRLAMEMVGLHLPEIIALKAGGDQPVPIRCGAAEFGVDNGVMHARTLVFDTAVTTVFGSGNVDLATEKLGLTLTQRTKKTSLVSLRTPIHVRGSFAEPSVELETGRIAARGLGAAALGAANPLLLLIPLIEQGPGKDSDCGRLFSSAGMAGGKAPEAPASAK